MNDVIKPEDVTFVVPGQTTIEEVFLRMGSPSEITETPFGPIMRYRFLDSKYFNANYAWPLRFLFPFYSPQLELSGGGIELDEWQLFLDSKWIVQQHAFSLHPDAEYQPWPFDLEPPEPYAVVSF
ncbi:MAG: hypothetical protein ACT4OO_03690 [Nitrospiraceae bacterium]